MADMVYVVQGFGPAPEASPLTVAACFGTSREARRHACILGLFCAEVTVDRRPRRAGDGLDPVEGQEKARMGDSGF